jgi:hypothetical protein
MTPMTSELHPSSQKPTALGASFGRVSTTSSDAAEANPGVTTADAACAVLRVKKDDLEALNALGLARWIALGIENAE